MTYPNPTMVTISVSPSSGAQVYHTDQNCKGLANSKTRQIAKHKIPNARLCKRCENGGACPADYSDQSKDLNEFLKNLDATDVPRGQLADAVKEECE